MSFRSLGASLQGHKQLSYVRIDLLDQLGQGDSLDVVKVQHFVSFKFGLKVVQEGKLLIKELLKTGL